MLRDVREEAASRLGSAEVLPWADLYAAHAPELVVYLARLIGDREAAAELMQDTFIAGMRDEGQLQDRARVRAWLYRIATRLGTKWLRRRRLLAFVPFTGREPAPGGFNAERDAIRQALGAISADQAAALLLHYGHGFTRAEIAQLSDRSEEAIKSRLARGRRAFLSAYTARGGDQ